MYLPFNNQKSFKLLLSILLKVTKIKKKSSLFPKLDFDRTDSEFVSDFPRKTSHKIIIDRCNFIFFLCLWLSDIILDIFLLVLHFIGKNLPL